MYALGILLTWAASLAAGLLLNHDASRMGMMLAVAHILLQTFLYTGVFITAHDGMHGGIAPGRARLNNALGWICTMGYALFSFATLREEHGKHHRNPGTSLDPDFHDGIHQGFLPWYTRFLLHYISWKQLLGMAVVFNLLVWGAGLPESRVLLFWVLPNLLSTVQLFFFGTYLPHRSLPEGFVDHHRARSNAYPVWLSFLTCYHFGYHLEHHRAPHIPWWRLRAR